MAVAVRLPDIQESEWAAFVRENGRIPLLGDKKAPWEYPGWLLYYRVAAEIHPDVPQRWSYWIRTMESNRLLDELIPQIEFDMSSMGEKSEGYKQITKLTEIVNSRFTRSPLNDLLDFWLWGLGGSTDNPKLDPDTSEKLYRTINLEPFLLKPYDYLGEWIAMHKGNWNPHAFFPTPHSVCELMTQVNFAGLSHEQSRDQSVCDPAVGSGRMLLHASNHSLLLYGADIDPVMVKVSKINAALYVPWLARPFPSRFFGKGDLVGLECRNSLKNPPTERRKV